MTTKKQCGSVLTVNEMVHNEVIDLGICFGAGPHGITLIRIVFRNPPTKILFLRFFVEFQNFWTLCIIVKMIFGEKFSK